LKKYWKIN